MSIHWNEHRDAGLALLCSSIAGHSPLDEVKVFHANSDVITFMEDGVLSGAMLVRRLARPEQATVEVAVTGSGAGRGGTYFLAMLRLLAQKGIALVLVASPTDSAVSGYLKRLKPLHFEARPGADHFEFLTTGRMQ